MKIICSKLQLMDIINTVQKAISTKSTMPILECIKIDATANGAMIVTGNNLELCIEYNSVCEIQEGGSIALTSKIFGEIIRRLPDGDITIEVNEENNVTKIKNGSSEFNIQGLTTEEYPSAPEIKEKFSFTIKQDVLKKMIRKTIFSVSPNEITPIYTGALFDIKNNQLNVVTTDKYRLSLITENIAGDLPNSKFVIPAVTLRELLKILKDDEDVKIVVADRHVLFDFGYFKVITRLLEGEFLNYSPIMQTNNKIFATVETRKFCDCLERASLLINEDISSKMEKVPVKLNINYDKIEINCMTSRGMVHDIIDVKLDGDGIEIGFNNRYLLDALRATEEETVKMEFSTPKSACFIHSVGDDENYTYMILPVRLYN